MRLRILALAPIVLWLAGCGGGKVVGAFPKTVIGTVPKAPTVAKGDPVAGKKLFTSEGCTGCHTYAPAGSNATVGPDLDKLAQYAKQANQGPLQQFVETSITTPGAYIQPGFQNVMPTTYANLPAKQIADLVAFLTQKQ